MKSERFLGLELSGAKNDKTALTVLEHYPKEKKIFVLDVFEKIGPAKNKGSDQITSGDEALIEIIQEHAPFKKLAVNVPLTLPPCIICTKAHCPLSTKCTVPSVKWMREKLKKIDKRAQFTPYTQRPVELWIKHYLLADYPKDLAFDVDEALGGNRAPLTARMQFLSRHLGFKKNPALEVWPKLTLLQLSQSLHLTKRQLLGYRKLEQGVYFRQEILTVLVKRFGLFVYDRDLAKLSQNLTSFDSFICALTAQIWNRGQTAAMPKGFPKDSGWVTYPMSSQAEYV